MSAAAGRSPLVVGLTGGIGSGKTAVAEAFAARGVPVTDTDRIAHALTAPGAPGWQAIRDAFGPALFGPDDKHSTAARCAATCSPMRPSAPASRRCCTR